MNRERKQLDMTGVVLAGGMSSRFGVNKALIPWKDKRLIEGVLDVLSGLFPVTLVLVKHPDRFRFLDRPGIRVRGDVTRETHPLGGILSGLTYTETGRTFVCACDMPYLRGELIEALYRESDGYDVTVPVWNDRPQPLCAVYATSCVGPIESMISRQEYTIFELYGEVRTRYFREDEVREVDPGGISFVDVDTVDDYLAARQIAGQRSERDD